MAALQVRELWSVRPPCSAAYIFGCCHFWQSDSADGIFGGMATAELRISVADTEQMRIAIQALGEIAADHGDVPAPVVAEEALVQILTVGTGIEHAA